MPTTVLPSILSATEDEAIAKIAQLPPSVAVLHLDIMDGEFVPRTFWAEPKKIRDALPPTMRYEAHFMVADPIAYCHLWANGNDDARMVRMIFHVSAIESALEEEPLYRGSSSYLLFTELETCVRSANKEFWIAWNPDVPFDRVQALLPHVDGILVMGGMPGYSGKKGNIDEACAHIRHIRAEHATIPISVDIGVNDRTAPLLRAAGATHLVSGSYLFAEDGRTIDEKIKILQNR